MSDVVRWGILSTARINDLVLAGLERSRFGSVAAVASRDIQRAQTYARSRSIREAFGSYEDLLRADDVDAVYISLPNSMHVEWAIRALKAGKHVLCEKPLTRSEHEAARAFDLAAQQGKMLVEAFMYRYHPQTTAARKMIADRAIGEVRHVNASMSFTVEGKLADDPRGQASLQGGALLDVACYCVSAIRLFAGEINRVAAFYESAGEIDGRCVGIVQCAGDATGSFDSGLTLPRRDRLEIVGTAGTIVLDDPWHCRSSSFVITDLVRQREELIHHPKLVHDIVDAYFFEMNEISKAIIGGSELEFGREDAIKQARALAALHRAAAEASVIDLI